MTTKELNDPVSGFYYDNQTNNELMSVSLHYNTVKITTKSKEGVTGVEWARVPKEEEDQDNISDTEGRTYDKTHSERPWKYSKIPLCKSVINEDFQVSVANNWSEFGGDPIGELWNNYKPMAGYLMDIGQSIKEITEKSKAYINSNGGVNSEGSQGTFNKVVDGLSGFLGGLGNQSRTFAKYLNRSLVAEGTRFTYYGGTGISFGTSLGMRFTIFTGYQKEGDRYVFRTVDEQVKKINDYVIGDFIPVTELNGKLGGIGNLVEEFFSWQLPPAGYLAGIKDIDSVQKGTLRLKVGTYYSIDNLVIADAVYNYSKEMAKAPVISGRASGKVFPLFCEVNLTLKPSTKYSQHTLARFLDGKTTKHMRKELEDKMERRLSKLNKVGDKPINIKKI